MLLVLGFYSNEYYTIVIGEKQKQLVLEVAVCRQYNQPKMRNQKVSGWKMNRVKTLSFAACVVVGILGGCAKQQQFKTVEQICVSDLDKAKAMRMAEDVLGEMHFDIEKSDIEQGLIRSKPLAGAQFFEFWRKDSIGAFNWAESNLHSIRRIVEIDVRQEVDSTGSPQDGRLCVDCNVSVQRLSVPERLLRGRGQSYDILSASSPAIQKLTLDTQQKTLMAWVDLGRDELLATEILKRIENKAAKMRKGK